MWKGLHVGWALVLTITTYIIFCTPFSNTPKITHPTFTQHQQLELRVERLEKIVGLKGKEARKEGLQFKIK